MDSAAVLDDEVSGDDISDEECPCGGRGVWYVLAARSTTCYGRIAQTIRPPMRLENKEHRIQSDPDERCAHGQTNRQHHVDPVSLRRWINEIRNDAWRRLQARPIEHRLCCRCHRLRRRIGILRHGDCMGNNAALVPTG